MLSFTRFHILIIVFLAALYVPVACDNTRKASGNEAALKTPDKVLVFTKTKGFYHESIPTGASAIISLGIKNDFIADTTADAAYFTEEKLKNYKAVIFLNTTQNVLNADQQVAFERFIQAGGGFVGVHAAADTEYDWPWYNKLVGAYFESHPHQQKAIIKVTDTGHLSSRHLPATWERFDEWYNFKNVQNGLKTLAWLDESTYEGGNMGDKHPFAWYHEFDGGRAFYTAGGHTHESYSDSLFLNHLLGGIKYAIGTNTTLDYSKSYSVRSPEDNRFTKTILSDDLNEPMELAVAPDGRVFFTERSGKFYVYLPAENKTRLLHHFPAKAVDKYLNGLIGVTLDPDFVKNNYIYFFYSSSTGEEYHQNVSRFEMTPDGRLDTTSEKILIKIPIDLEVSAHTGGSLAWDKNRNLYISTGDNTVPFESHGYAPIDERKGRLTYDAQRTASNTNDLRGKILRIHPEPDGTYTIPAGNLFPKGTPQTRPEIYVMGCRNPYRITVDKKTSILYWGEVGPDAGHDSRHGPRGYDEINQAKTAGNYGWPYFVGNNKAYNDSNFATKEIGVLYDLNGATNNSPNNTGARIVPPARPAMIWYPYNQSEEFPMLANGGRCAMAGPLYHFDPSATSPDKIPEYYDGALFMYDWMRNWVFAVMFDENNNYQRMEPFMQANGDFRRPVDLEIGADGVMYMLEYGSVYGIDNVDARLVKITYNGGNRPPVAVINAKDSIGAEPLQLTFDGNKSFDLDDDAISYRWLINGKQISTDSKASYRFEEKGIYQIVLQVWDAKSSSADTMQVIAGNTAPLVEISTSDNRSFFFDQPSPFSYAVKVNDREDGEIDEKRVKFILNYIPKIIGPQNKAGHQEISGDYNIGAKLIESSDCKACHQLNAKAVGPSFMDVSRKYGNDKNIVPKLAAKIISGGGGVWGDHAMNAHPQLSVEEASDIVQYILSLSSKPVENILPLRDTIELKEHAGNTQEGRYIFNATYTDKGNGVMPLTGKAVLMLRPSKVQAEYSDRLYESEIEDDSAVAMRKGSWMLLRKVDLKDINALTCRIATKSSSACIDIRKGGPRGTLLGTISAGQAASTHSFTEIRTTLNDPGGLNDLYFVCRSNDESDDMILLIDWLRFEGGKKVGKTAANVNPAPSQIKEKNSQKKIQTVSAAKNKNVNSTKQGHELLLKSDCNSCHSQNVKLVGPSYMDISKRYAHDRSSVSRLAEKIIKGGAGSWGEVPMAPHPGLSKKEAELMVKYIFTLR